MKGSGGGGGRWGICQIEAHQENYPKKAQPYY